MTNQVFPTVFADIEKYLKTNDNFLISTHYSPDGDAIGSTLGMGEMLRIIGKKAVVVVEGGIPEKYRFLNNPIVVYDPLAVETDAKFSNIIILDAGAFERIGKSKLFLDDNYDIVNIDHHLSNDKFGRINYIDTDASSVAEILFGLAQYLRIDFTPELASFLYLGIMTDTGRFRFGNTSYKALSTAAELVKLGADPAYLSEGVFFDLPHSYIETLAICLNSLEYFDDGRIALMEYHEEKEIEDSEGFIDLAIGTRGVKAAAFIRSMENGKFKVSLRSRSQVDVRRIAESHGGGGHRKAAGFRSRASLEQLKSTIIKEILQQLPAE